METDWKRIEDSDRRRREEERESEHISVRDEALPHSLSLVPFTERESMGRGRVRGRRGGRKEEGRWLEQCLCTDREGRREGVASPPPVHPLIDSVIGRRLPLAGLSLSLLFTRMQISGMRAHKRVVSLSRLVVEEQGSKDVSRDN